MSRNPIDVFIDTSITDELVDRLIDTALPETDSEGPPFRYLADCLADVLAERAHEVYSARCVAARRTL